ncbi:hypothetical protein ABFS82_14G294700 [Erythranthe guttata]|uniref:tetrapyrrole-binding protein, chloroplastic n=1 Tax=Erythranthe guttata TaxID=4155 RepID=UPI00064DEAA6|nr:PREDICTED: tetrapyrrole-binding protein, chloroplastic [Erythranthe guttata]|eukprot:XP_012839107.1 PREDICTED: tetrapyrrole-binding protein, chloroplastic [Erythranthe guttata]
MATNAFNSICHHHHHSLRRRHSLDCHPTTTTTTNPFFLRPTTTTTLAAVNSLTNSTAAFAAVSSAGTATTNPSTNQNVSFDLLEQHLSTKNYREADDETRRLLIVLAGESAETRGYVFFSEVQFISEQDLKTIDALWRKYSNEKFGYSVQKKIWKKSNRDFTKFFIKVGWMKLLESSEVVQYNYRAFPGEFMWEMEEGTPEGHLPLTNALRGTQLLTKILEHPAFGEDGDGEDEDDDVERESSINGIKPLSKNFKTTYTF